jgi:2-keto-4-pentenoate hydratase/2-oxohepta-3-ene-1,7-dioic acid hydratase in catechol pathway
MKLVSFEVATAIGPVVRIGAVVADRGYLDLNAVYRHFLVSIDATPEAARRIADAVIPPSMVAFIQAGPVSLDVANQAIAHASGNEIGDGPQAWYAPESVTLLPPVPNPPMLRDFMAFETHLKNIYPKLGREIPDEWYNMPIYYKGNVNSLGTHEQEVARPYDVPELDYEFELAFVIGKGGKDIAPEQAMDHVFGYMIYNDFSERTIQGREMSVGLGPAKGKDFHNAHVFGPYLVTKDEIPDPYNLQLTSRINGETISEENSGSIHWKIEDMISHASRNERIVPGEIFGTGTVGNGSGAERGVLLKPGDVIELEAMGLGLLRNRVV